LLLISSGTATPSLQNEEQIAFNPAQIKEFTPQNYDLTNSVGYLLADTLSKLRLPSRLYLFFC
jgi:hypothetical protein